jgi:hypothetical protein
VVAVSLGRGGPLRPAEAVEAARTRGFSAF